MDALLGARADPTVTNKHGKTPAQSARDCGRTALAAKLEAAARWRTERLLWLAKRDQGSPLRLLPPELLHLTAQIHGIKALS